LTELIVDARWLTTAVAVQGWSDNFKERNMTRSMTNRRHGNPTHWRPKSKPAGRHWLLDTMYGRGVLKEKLRQARPDLKVPVWEDGWELDPLLDELVDALGLRQWPRPEGFIQCLAYLRAIVRISIAVHFRRPVPHWGV
jgi:hypothetical protein